MKEQDVIKFLNENPAIFANLYPEQAKAIFAPALAKTNAFGGYPGSVNPQFKHGTVDALENQMPGPLYEDSFFVDCNLDRSVINATFFPKTSIVSMLPVRRTLAERKKFGFITNISSGLTGDEPDFVCDPPEVINFGVDACKIELHLGRKAIRSEVGETNDLIKRACEYEPDLFFFVGENGFSRYRGVSDDMPSYLDPQADRNLIMAAALRKQLQFIGLEFQKWLIDTVWNGDDTATPNGGYKSFWGLDTLINGDYPNSGLPLEALGGDTATCEALNSCIRDFENECICTGTKSLYRELQNMEAELYNRAHYAGLLPMRAFIFMHPKFWDEFVKCLDCEMMSDGCVNNPDITRTIDLSVVNRDLTRRIEFLNNRRLVLNGRMYEIILDDSLPFVGPTETAPGVWEMTSSVYFIPFTVSGGRRVIWLEHLDYSQIARELRPIDGSEFGIKGSADGGRYHIVADVLRWCFQLNAKTEPRLVFIAPFLAGKIENVNVCVEGCDLTAPQNIDEPPPVEP